MSSKAMSLKGRIKNYAKSNNIAAQVVLQNYMFECLFTTIFTTIRSQQLAKICYNLPSDRNFEEKYNCLEVP